jgi:hypothetical protein
VLYAVLPNSSIYSMLKINRQASNPDLEGNVYKVIILLILFSVSISSPTHMNLFAICLPWTL